jgi:hypothetical protein
MIKAFKISTYLFLFTAITLCIYINYFAPIKDRLDPFVFGIYSYWLFLAILVAVVIYILVIKVKSQIAKISLLIIAYLFYCYTTYIMIGNILFPKLLFF